MKKIILTNILLALVFMSSAQNSEDQKKPPIQNEVSNGERELLLQMARDRNLVIEATAIYGRHGFNSFDIGPNNFISIDSSRFVMQTSNANAISQNGVGGVTIRGNVSSYEIRRGKGKRPITIIAQVNTYGFGLATVTLRLFSLKNSQATFMNARNTLTLSGPITTTEESYVFKGVDAY